MSIRTISARSSDEEAAPQPRSVRCSPVLVGGASASMLWTPTSSSLRMELVVGRVVKAHGVSGEIVVEVRTDDPDTRFAAGSLLTGRPAKGEPAREYTIESSREHG